MNLYHESHSRGRRFDPAQLHQFTSYCIMQIGETRQKEILAVHRLASSNLEESHGILELGS